MPPVKEQVKQVLEQLPDDCSLEDVQYRLYLLQKVREGGEAIERGDVLAHDDVKRRLARWLNK